MKTIDVRGMDASQVNESIRHAQGVCRLTGCCGQRFIASGMKPESLEIEGIPGNALGAYLGGGQIVVCGNAQDAVGDTMNDGCIVIHGGIGDAAGYAMRGGAIYIKGNAGYRAGIHMKEYHEKKPVLVIGGRAGSFLGEYQAGGRILVLGLHTDGKPIVGNFPCTGMHGGRMILRGDASSVRFPDQVTTHAITPEEREEIRPYISFFCAQFGYCEEEMMADDYTVVAPDSKNPYRQMYVAN